MDAFTSYILSFAVGGIICVIAQILIDKTKLTPARILVIYVCVGVFLTAVGIYGPLVEIAGGGAATPLTGFGYAIAKGVREAVDKDGLIGAITGGLSATSTGITSAIVFSFIASLLFSSKPKR